MGRVEFGERGVHVVDIEEDLQDDSTFLADTVQLEQLVARCPNTYVCSAHHQSCKRQALTAHGDNLVTLPHGAHLDIAPDQAWPFAGRTIDTDDLPATLDEDVGCVLLLGLAPGFAIESSF
jgi:hypothetical protein